MLSSKNAMKLAYGTSLVVHCSPFVPELMHGKAPEVKKSPIKLEKLLYGL
jgi:hypothetical protein